MTTSDLWCATCLVCMLCAGYAAMPGLGRSRMELFGLAACLGPAIFGFYLIVLSFVGFVPTRFSILALAAVCMAIVAWKIHRHRKSNVIVRAPRTPILWITIAIVAVGYGVSTIGYDSLISPTTEWDAFAIWQLKAKILASFPLSPRPQYFTNLNLSYSHLAYPILFSMISAGSMAMSGPAHDELGKAPLLLMYFGLGAVIFARLRETTRPQAAVAVTSMMLLLPTFLDFGGTGIAELPLIAFYAASIVCLLRWQERGHQADLILAAVFSAAMAWTKNEGLALAGINALVVFMLPPILPPLKTSGGARGGTADAGQNPQIPTQRSQPSLEKFSAMNEDEKIAAHSPASKKGVFAKNFLPGIAFTLLIIAIFAPWWLYARSIPRTDEDYSSRLNLPLIQNNLGRVPVIVTAFYKEFTNLRDWNLFWILIPSLAILNPSKPRRPVITLWILFTLHIAACSAAYLVTNWKLEDLIPVSINRLVLHMIPTGALLIGLQWPGKAKIERSSNREMPFVSS